MEACGRLEGVSGDTQEVLVDKGTVSPSADRNTSKEPLHGSSVADNLEEEYSAGICTVGIGKSRRKRRRSSRWEEEGKRLGIGICGNEEEPDGERR
ncbi:hypothetical protein E2C01_036117 [Portunus trituberculatus]|uniref:Uncharacterized protein n=1 Tax=Portunus trituberculatus TaxID=210409 RepID=A0A5B7FA91_PORTR|nr:hypothetical protein [Portunus trituberculatus]